MDLYGYVLSDPINTIDPSGLAGANACPDLPVPPGEYLDENMKEANERRLNLLWFYQQVRNGGPWDYKQQGGQYEDLGNFNYGATGSALGLPGEVLKRGAGLGTGEGQYIGSCLWALEGRASIW